MRIQWSIYLLVGLILVGCGGQSGGVAPSNGVPQGPPAANPPEPIIADDTMSNYKYGEVVSSINGWEASMDTTDPVENVTIANGWQVEVKYE